MKHSMKKLPPRCPQARRRRQFIGEIEDWMAGQPADLAQEETAK